MRTGVRRARPRRRPRPAPRAARGLRRGRGGARHGADPVARRRAHARALAGRARAGGLTHARASGRPCPGRPSRSWRASAAPARRCGSSPRAASASATPRRSTRATPCTRSRRTSITPGLVGLVARVLGGGTAPTPGAGPRRDGGPRYARPLGDGRGVPRVRRHDAARALDGARLRLHPRDRRRPLRAHARPAARLRVDRCPRVRSGRPSRATRQRLPPRSRSPRRECSPGSAAAAKVTGRPARPVARPRLRLAAGARSHARTLAPWAGLAAGAVVVAPMVAFEAHTGWPMLAHRLVDTQQGAGLSLRNAGTLVGGPARLPVAPGRRPRGLGRPGGLGRARRRRGCAPLVARSPFHSPSSCRSASGAAWPSRTGSPQPCSRSLPRSPGLLVHRPRARVAAAAAIGAVMVVAVHAWVLVPAAARLAPASVRSALRSQQRALRLARSRARGARAGRRRVDARAAPGDVAVVGPHWVVCAQLDAALRGEIPVGCDTPVRDDFDTGGRAPGGATPTRSSGSPTPASARHRTCRTTRPSASESYGSCAPGAWSASSRSRR